MKTTISIPDSDFKAAEKVAKRLGMSRSELYQVAVAEFLARHTESDITEKLDEIYAPQHETASIPQMCNGCRRPALQACPSQERF